jgi:hypothetical protein
MKSIQVRTLYVLMLIMLSLTFTGCAPDIIDDPVDKLDFAAKAREIIDDGYIYDGTQEDYLRLLNISTHFDTILQILGIEVVDDASQVTPDGPMALTSAQYDFLFQTIYTERTNAFLNTNPYEGIVYYPLADVPEFLASSGLQIARTQGLGDIAKEELQGVMDYYIDLYENNTTVTREYFAGYLIGAIAKNNPDVGTLVDQYSLDKLQLLLFVIDALTLPEDSPLAAAAQNMTAQSISPAAGAAQSHWGAGAKKLNIQPVNTKQKVIDIVGDTVKDYSYKFSVIGATSIYCDSWPYTASVMRTCRWTAGTIDPGDCSGMPEPVAGIRVNFTAGLQEHDFILAPLIGTGPDGTLTEEAVCEKSQCKIKRRTPGTRNVNGYVEASFNGTDNSLTPPYPIFPARAYIRVTERVGDQIECYTK